MPKRYNPPPNWPAPPEGWTPPAGWQPSPDWGPPPPGWQLWIDDKKKMGTGAKLGLVGGGLLFVLVACSVAVAGAGGGSDTVEPAAAATTEEAASEEPAVDQTTAPPAETTTAAPAEEKPVEPAAPGFGVPVRDGKFEFVVNGMECGIPKVGDDFLNKTAQGQFCLVDLSIKNIGDRAQTFFGDNTYVLNEAGQQFSADTEAGIYLDESNSFIEEINPGNSITGKVVFDVPAGMTPVTIELHDSAFSGGVEVALR